MNATAEDVSEVARLDAEPGPEERYIDSEDETVRDGWRIESVHSLDWALSRIADLEREQAENTAIVEEHIQRLKLRLEKLNAKAERGLKFFRSQVQAYAEANRDTLLGGGKKKSRTLPHGTVGWKKKPEALRVKDEKALIEWARQQPVEAEVLRIKEEPALKEISKLFKASGEVPDGMELEPESEELTIKANGSDE